MLPPSDEDVAKLKDAVAEVRDWLDIKLRTGRYFFGFVLELAQHAMSRTYNIHTIYDENSGTIYQKRTHEGTVA